MSEQRESLALQVAGETRILIPERHCWELYTPGVNSKTGEPVKKRQRWYRDLTQVAEAVGDEALRGAPSIEEGIAAVRELAAALRGMANQLPQPETPWAA